MTKSKIGMVVALVASFIPSAAFAVGENIINLINSFGVIVSKLLPILVAVALIYFIWGLISYLISAEGEARDDGKMRMWWGIIALFVIVSIWGITTFIRDTLGITNQESANAPKVIGL